VQSGGCINADDKVIQVKRFKNCAKDPHARPNSKPLFGNPGPGVRLLAMQGRQSLLAAG
jgi:hypothetical protein